MPYRRSSGQRHRRKAPRVKIVRYVVPTTRRASDHPMPLMVPTRWVKNIIALFLLPWCAILTQTFFTAFTRATIHQQLWAGAEFWFFTLGAVLWLIAFFGLPRPVIIYVFGHELTHVLWVWLMGGRVSKFRVSGEGGHIVTNRTNFLIALDPYFFPLVFIYVMNLLLLSALLASASPQVTFASFAADLVANLRSFSEWVGELLNQFTA